MMMARKKRQISSSSTILNGYVFMSDILCGLLRIPSSNNVISQSPMHTKSLANLKHQDHSYLNQNSKIGDEECFVDQNISLNNNEGKEVRSGEDTETLNGKCSNEVKQGHSDEEKDTESMGVNKGINVDVEIDKNFVVVPTELDCNGSEIVIFDEMMVVEGGKRWDKTLCGYFMGYNMSVNELRYNLRRMWSRHGFKGIIDFNNGIYLIKFHSDEGFNHVVDNGPWMTTKGISALASRVGKPMVIDQITATLCKEEMGRFRFTRVLVEVSASKPLPNKIEVVYKNGLNEKICKKIVKLVYDWKPPMCNKCCVFGHTSVRCSKKHGEEAADTVGKDANMESNKDEGTKYVVPTGRVAVPTGRVAVPTGRYVVPTSRVLSPGSDNESDEASVHNEATNTQQQPNIQPQIITTVSNNNAKFPYLKKDEYEVCAMKMKYWITNNDMNIGKVIQNGNNMKRIGRDRDGRVIILPSTTAEEHIAVQRESKARTTLLQSIPDDHVADFHYMDDARDIWNAVKAMFGGNAESRKMRKMQKIMSQLNQLKAKPEDEDINLKFLRALPSLWSQVALTLKTKGGLELLSFDDLYYKLKTSPSYSSSTTYSAPSNSKTGSHRSDYEQIEKLDLEEMDLKWKMAMLSVRVHKFEQKDGRKIDFDKKEFARFNKKKVRCYRCQQRGHFARECRAKGGNDKQRYSSFKIKEIGKKEENSKALITVDTLVDWTYHDGESDGVITSKEFGMIVGCDTEDAIKEGAAKIYNLITGADTEEASTTCDAGEFALISVTSENKMGLGFNKCVRENELGWDDSVFSVFTTTSEDMKGRPLFNRFAKADSMKDVHPPLSGDYTSLSDHTDLDESQMSYGTKSSTSSDSKSVSNNFVSCDDSDKSSEVNTNDCAFSDSSVNSSEPNPNDSTSCALICV
nr:hypothetical protein [Tanacetum cinerariifolium]